MRIITPLFLLLFCSTAFSQIVVELAAFDEEVELSYFKGFDKVYLVKNQHNINRYYVNANGNEDALVQKGIEIGLNPRVIDVTERKRLCSASCVSYEDLEKLQNIFFDFDKSNLRTESVRRLELLHTILIENKDYKVEFRAHTDAKGSLEYNEALAQRRANSAEQYLLDKGISSARISTSLFGERAPIAKNDINGNDTPEGRQLNRRVEVVIYDNTGQRVNLVEAIYVPPHLQN